MNRCLYCGLPSEYRTCEYHSLPDKPIIRKNIHTEFPDALHQVQLIYEYGREKYPDSSARTIPREKNKNAMARHMFNHYTGKLLDDESGYYHLAHIAFRCLVELQQRYEEDNE